MKVVIRGVFLLLVVFATLSAGELFDWNNADVLAQRSEWRRQAQEKFPPDPDTRQNETGSPRSVKKAVIFSALLPGSGQAYSKSYVKAALFLAVEVSAWALNVTYNKRGDDKVEEFENYADSHWSEYRYWSYVAYKAEQLNLSGLPDLGGGLINDGKGRYLIPPDYYTAETIAELRKLEENYSSELGFSHHLPHTKTQQYYEMIGKYPAQFGYAWDDADFTHQYSGYTGEYTTNNRFYEGMRDDSNRFYEIAGYGVMTALVNHVIAAIDAGFSTRRYNRRHQPQVSMSYSNRQLGGEYMNMFGLNVNW